LCPGRHLAINNVWIVAAMIIAIFDVSKAIDEDGNIIEPTLKLTGSGPVR
jgi:hypothetical protein